MKNKKRLNTHYNPISHRYKINEINLEFDDYLNHYVHVPPEIDNEPINFEWHFQRGLLSPRMSGLELCEFVLKHMQSILSAKLLDNHPKIHTEFHAMFILLSTSPAKLIDRLLPWIKVKYHEQDDDIVFLSLFNKEPQKSGATYFI